MTDDTNKQIAELEAKIAKLEASITPAPYDPAAAAKWRDEMHQLAERRMSAASAFSRALVTDWFERHARGAKCRRAVPPRRHDRRNREHDRRGHRVARCRNPRYLRADAQVREREAGRE